MRPSDHPPAQSMIIRVTFCTCQHSVAGEWEREQQESKSVREQQVPAPSFYKLQPIGHLVFSTQCNTPTTTPTQAPATPLLLSHVVLRWAAVTGQTHCDLEQPPTTTTTYYHTPPPAPLNSSRVKGK